jgi:cytosine/adenosine deaminase-related metal-dependent hydrolase
VKPFKLIVHNVLVITMAATEGSEAVPFRGWLAVTAEGRLAAVEAGDPPTDAVAEHVVDAGGSFVAPGFISAHSHLFTSGSRGLGMDEALYGWGDAMSVYTRQADAEDIYWCTLHGALDFLSNGITTAYDFTDSRLPASVGKDGQRVVLGPLKPAAYAQAQIRGKVDAGLRFVNSVMLNDEIGTGDEVLGRFAETMAYAEGYIDTGLYLGSAISGAVQWSPNASTASLEVAAMRRFGVINQPHFLETAQQTELQRSKWAWYREAGAFGRDLIFGHFVQATADMIAEAGRCGCGMVWQPTSNGRLASGFADIPACVAAGVRVGVGLDDQSCTDISDPWQNMRMGIYTQRAHRRDPRAMGVEQMLRLHTIGSAAVLGIDDRVGSLEVGKYADFLIVDPRDPDTGPIWNPIGTYVLACGLRNLKAVYRGGDLVSQSGRSTNPLAVEASRQLHARLARIAARMRSAADTLSAELVEALA